MIFRPERMLRIGALGRVYVALLMVVTAVSIGTAAFFISHVERLEETWQSHEQGASRKMELLGAARSSLGYGGLTHHLKMFITSADPNDLIAASQALLEVGVVITDYRSLGVSREEEAALADIAGVMEVYRQAIANAEILAAINSDVRDGPVALNDAVTVDDAPALDALRRLDQIALAARESNVAAISQGVITLKTITIFGAASAGGFFILLATIFGSYVRAQVLAPIQALVGAFRAIDPSQSIDARLPVRDTRWPNELDDLAHGGNKLLDAIADQFEKRQLADAALEVSESRVQAIVNQSAEGIVSIDAHGLIESFNPAAEQMFGYAAQDVIGQNVSLLSPVDERHAHETFVDHSDMHAPRIINLARDLIGARKDGTTFPLELNVAPMQVDGRKMFVGIMRDISERTQMEAARLETESMFKDLYENAPVAYGSGCGTEGRINRSNDAFAQLLGYRREEMQGLGIDEVYADTPDGLPKAEKLLSIYRIGKTFQPDEGSFTAELQMKRKDGEIIWVSVSTRPHLDEAGQLIESRSAIIDITERKRAEEELRDNERQLRDLYQNAPVGYSSRSAIDGSLVRSNAAFAEITGYSTAELAEMSSFDIYADTPDGRPKVEKIFADFQANPRPMNTELQLKRKSGELIWILGMTQPHFDENGALIEARSVITDITDRRVSQAKIETARAEAEAANRAKSEFLSSMSHELRTPMNTVLGFAQVLQSDPDSPLTEDQSESVDQIIHGGRHLLELINEVLDLSRIENGVMELSTEKVDLGDLVSETLDLIRPLAANRSIALVNELAPDSGQVWSDYTRLKQVLLNLLSNAVKYNVLGGTVTVRTHPTTEGRARLAVIDTGPGIAARDLDGLFVPFERLGADLSDIEGTGIGLTITKRLVEMMDGEIGVQSQVGRGSTFWVDLPREAHEGTPLYEPVPFTGVLNDPGFVGVVTGAYTVLYVEDNPANVRLMRKIFALRPKWSLIEAGTGEWGLEMAAAYRPDAVIVDINLPGIDGFEVFQRLQIADEGRNTPVIALSAGAMPKDVKRGRDAGFFDYLTKPLDIPALLATLDLALATRMEAAE